LIHTFTGPIHATFFPIKLAFAVTKFNFTIWDGLVFGALLAFVWGRSAPPVLLAAVAFLLYLLVRSQLSRSSAGASIRSDDNEFVLENDELSQATVELDADIDNRPRKNHFRIDSMFDTCRRHAEFEYKIEETAVFVRLLHESLEDIDIVKTWEVRDGVLLEADFRERQKGKKWVLEGDIDEEIAARKKPLEWHEILPSYWNGMKYFILSKNLPKDDSRRFFRQEIERLKLGSNRFIEQAAKIGFIHDETSDWRLRLPGGADPPEDERQALFDSIRKFDLSYDEFTMAPGLVAALEKYLA